MKFLKAVSFLLFFGAVALLSSCKVEGETDPVTPAPPNILLIIADDLGKDAIAGYPEGAVKPSTPNIDGIRNSGLAFNNLWVYPTCTPTRASIITGKYGYRTGIKWASDELAASETTLQRYINDNTSNAYATAIVGKWHLSGSNSTVNPESFGIDYYAGLIRGAVNDYYNWQFTENGTSSLRTDYTTTAFTDLSIDWINDQSKPWFLWLAYNAPHTPFHAPPETMHNQGNLPAYQEGMDPLPYYLAAIEAMDDQIGRLLANIPAAEKENTLILFLGDNGTPNDAAQSPYANNNVKGTLYQGGINVPMFVSGKGVTRVGTDNNLITGTDLFATIAEIAGVDATQIHDSKSFKSLLSQPGSVRTYQYSEMDNGNNDAWAIRDDQYKLIVNANGNEEMYDLIGDPYEAVNLLDGSLDGEASSAKARLAAELLNIRN